MKTRRITAFILVVSLAFLLMPETTLAGGPPMVSHNVDFLGQIGGEPYAIALQGTYAYAGVGPNLFILDIADPATPQAIGRLLLQDTVTGVAVDGNYAYVANRWFGLRVVDVSEPANPREVGSWESYGWAYGMAVADEYAYFTTSEGLSIINIADPANPMPTGAIDTEGYGQHVLVRGNYAYYADGSAGLRVIDISNRAAPEEVGRCETATANDVALAGDYAYVASDKDGGLLKVVDVSDPTQPQQVASADTPGGGTYGVDVSGNYVFLTTHSGSVTELGMRIVDVSTPLMPRPVGFYYVPGWSQDVTVADGYAYVTCELDGGIRIVNVSDPSSPAEVGAWATLGNTSEVAAVDDYAYVSRGSTTSIINAANPADPTVVGSMPWPFFDFEAAGSHAFFASWDLRIVDISNPAIPLEMSAFDTSRPVACLAAGEGRRVYLVEGAWWDGTAYTGGFLRIIDVSNILSPREVGYLALPGFGSPSLAEVEAIAVTSDHVYIAYMNQGLRIINVSDPTNPVEVGSLPSEEYTQGVSTDGQYVYWLAGSSLRVLDVSDPSQPVQVGTCETQRWAEQVEVVGSYAFVRDWSGLEVIDVSVPTNPAAIAWHGITTNNTSGIAVEGNLAYVTSLMNGLYLLRPLRDQVRATIGADGSDLSSTSGDTNLAFPAGAVTDTVQVVYRRWLFDERSVGDLADIGYTFNVSAVYSDTGQPALLAPGQFYTITLKYTHAEKGPAIEDTLGLYWWDEGASQWSQQGITSTVNITDNLVIAQVDHFSLFTVLGETQRVYLPLVLRND